jgi:hypothetical protein
MKKLFLLIGLISGIGMLNSCKNEPCDVVRCANNGVCNDGVCACPVGYEGQHCETAMRDKFIGIWNVNEDGSLSSQAQYSTSIEKGNKINEVKIYNVQNANPFKANAVTGVVKNDTLTIPFQVMPDNSKISGWGFIKGTNSLNQHYYQHATVTLYYEVTNPIGQVNKYGTTEGVPSIWSK